MLTEIAPPTTQSAIKPTEFTEMIRDKQYLDRFVDVLGPGAMSYVQSVVILYRSDYKLQACTPSSVIGAALRSAACQLQVDPFYRQAYLIPRPRKIKARQATEDKPAVPEHYLTEANFQPHYHGLEVLAHRTNLYRAINVSPIYKGQRVLEDVHTGLHYFTLADNDGEEISLDNGDAILAKPPRISQLRDATMGRRAIEDVIGYLAYFETFKGHKKTEWMTIEEIEAHAQKFSDAYTSQYSLWARGNPHRPVMQMKTVFIRLTKSMDLSGREHETLLKAVTAGDEAQQAVLEEVEAVDVIDNMEPRYTDEFSQEPPAPASPIVVNTTPMTTGGPVQAVSAQTQSSPRKTAEPLPVVRQIGVLPISYDVAKRYFLGPKMLENIGTAELEEALKLPKMAHTTKNAIRVVLGWREIQASAKNENANGQ